MAFRIGLDRCYLQQYTDLGWGTELNAPVTLINQDCLVFDRCFASIISVMAIHNGQSRYN